MKPHPQRHARINCTGKSCGEFNCDTCHPQEGELSEIANLKAGMAKVREHRDAALRRAEAQQARAMRAEQIIATYNRSGFADADRMAEEYLRVESELANCKDELAALKATPKMTYEEAFHAWNLTGPDSSQWEDLDESDRRRWVAMIDRLSSPSPSLPLEEPEQVISDGDINWIKTFGSSTLCKAMSELEVHRRASAARRGGK